MSQLWQRVRDGNGIPVVTSEDVEGDGYSASMRRLAFEALGYRVWERRVSSAAFTGQNRNRLCTLAILKGVPGGEHMGEVWAAMAEETGEMAIKENPAQARKGSCTLASLSGRAVSQWGAGKTQQTQ